MRASPPEFEVATKDTGTIEAAKAVVVEVRNDAEQKAYDDQIERLRHPHLTDFWSGLLDTGLSLTRRHQTENLAQLASHLQRPLSERPAARLQKERLAAFHRSALQFR